MVVINKRLAAVGLAIIIAGCGGGGDSSPPTLPPALAGNDTSSQPTPPEPAGTDSSLPPAVPPGTDASLPDTVPPGTDASLPPAVPPGTDASLPDAGAPEPAQVDLTPPPDGSRLLLSLPGSGTDPAQIRYNELPKLAGTTGYISAADSDKTFKLHSYLVHHDGLFWAMWSEGIPGVGTLEDEPGQQVRYATSVDGVNWGPSQTLSGTPAEGYAFIARGFWIRNGELLALAANFKGKGAFGVNKELQLQAFAWDPTTREWRFRSVLFHDAINNFAPERLNSGQWMMSRRDTRYNVYMLVGGEPDLASWVSTPVMKRLDAFPGFIPDEPIWWLQDDGSFVALYRDNTSSGRTFISTSPGEGQAWTTPVQTNFPNATSKLFSLKTTSGCRIVISNANPALARRDLHLATSRDGLVFSKLYMLDLPSPTASKQYPHAIEHDNALYITYSRLKYSIEVVRIPLGADLGACR